MELDYGFLTINIHRPQLGYLADGPKTDVWHFYVLPQKDISAETMNSVSADDNTCNSVPAVFCKRKSQILHPKCKILQAEKANFAKILQRFYTA